MHIWQAIKMAAKSLWTNKLRSFLTMLGIIIGVTTVSLLTTVAQGVSDAVVSSIRTQSTLAIFMNTSSMTSGVTGSTTTPITYSELDAVLKQNQKEADDPARYEYSMVFTSNGVVGIGDLENNTGDDNFIDGDFIKHSEAYDFNEIMQNLADNDLSSMQKIIEYSKLTKQRSKPISSTIYAVGKNFQEVYELKISGEYPAESDEILVDHEFVKQYFGEKVKDEDAIGSEISFGIEYYTVLEFEFKEEVDDSTRETLVTDIEANLKCMQLDPSAEVPLGYKVVGLKRLGEDAYTKQAEGATKMTLRLQFFQNVSSASVIENILNPLSANKLQIYDKLKVGDNDKPDANSVKLYDVYEKNNTKTFVISGVISEENSASMFTGTTNTSTEEDSIINVSMSDTKGTCYMLLDESNLPCLDIELSLGELPVTYAYLRYKSEDVMGESTTNVIISLMMNGKGHKYMTDFMLFSMSSVSNIIDDVMGILTTMLTVIAIISLIVGGIGIMNIMLVAVTERTREIGVRKAIGAKRSSILTQFLVEALALSLVGGSIGLIISAIGTAIIAHVIGFAMSMPLWVVGMSLGFCTAIGLIFGMFPAIKASRMQPIDALRRE